MQKTFLLRVAFLVLGVSLLLMTKSCLPPNPDNYTYYIYENSTDRDMALKKYYLTEDDGEIINYTFKINSRNSYVLLLEGYDFPPFIGGGEQSYIYFSNGTLGVTQHYPDKDNNYLFRKESYTVMPDTDGHKTYKYTFTEKDFEKGVPVEKVENKSSNQ